MTMESYDVIVVGAGWGGLVAAKTYLQLAPEARLLVVDNASTVGGTWSKERLYPHLVAEAHIGYYEFSDLEMRQDGEHVTPTGQITGEAVHEYLNSYVAKHGLQKYLRLGTKVARASRHGQLWHVNLQTWGNPGQEPTSTTVTSQKLIVATGLTSEPFIPGLPDDGFRGQVLHSKELGAPVTRELLKDESIKTVAVYGGSKSAFDAVYVLRRAGKRVQWIVRGAKGRGGVSVMTPLRMLGQDAVPTHYTRLLAALSPSVLGIRSSGFARWLHGGGMWSWLKQRFVMGYWRTATRLLTAEAQYDRSQNGRLLKPALGLDTVFWSPASLGVMTQPTLWEEIHKGSDVEVHENTIKRLEGKSIHLDDGSTVETDMLILATGWKALPDNFIFSHESLLTYGLSSPASFDPKTQATWLQLREQADKEVQQLLPVLRRSPGWDEHKPRVEDDFHLYRSVIPVPAGNGDDSDFDRSLAYIGFLRIAHSTVVFEAQSLWAAAYLQGLIDVPPLEQRQRETAMINAWIRRRYIYGRKLPYALNEFLPYVDMLCGDLGVNSRRKGSLLSEMFDPYKPSDFKGLVEEWKAARQQQKDQSSRAHKSGSGWDMFVYLGCVLGLGGFAGWAVMAHGGLLHWKPSSVPNLVATVAEELRRLKG